MGLAAAVAMLFVGAAVFLAVIWFLLPARPTQGCPRCGARQPFQAASCEACGGALPGPPRAHPGAPPYGFPEADASPRGRGARVEGGVAYNKGITRKAVTLATAFMGLGIALRLAGMAGALGLPQVPAMLDGALTVAGGLLAFVGFVFLDAA